ncbi:MAG: hypothetical protein RL698_1372 [Pseudomonadota bacterium]|jgi:bacterial/archaeal transporter family-2 protein
MPNPTYVLVALAGGLAITLQAHFMGIVDMALGTKTSVTFTYASGGLAAILLALATGGLDLRGAHSLPWWVFTNGLLGLGIVGAIGFVVPRMGAGRGLTLILVSQFLLAALIDHFGLMGAVERPLDAVRIAGFVLMLAGAAIVVR